MQIEFIDDVFRKGDLADIQFLMQICLYRGRHRIRIPLNRIKDTANYKNINERDRLMLETLFYAEATGMRPRASVRVSEERKSWEYFNLEEAARYLNQPFAIVLENNLNDQYFIEAIIKFLSNDELLRKNITNGWVAYVNGGGCDNVANVLEGMAKSFQNLPKSAYRYLRAYVLLDSDKEYPNDPIKDSYTKLLPRLDEMGVPYHVFYKRAMENYLPDEAFREIGAIPEPYRLAYLRLSSIQKDFFSIRRGFGRITDRTLLKHEVSSLYATVTDNDFDILNKGAEMPDFKSEFPKFMQHHQVFKTTLKQRTAHQPNPDELEQILLNISELL